MDNGVAGARGVLSLEVRDLDHVDLLHSRLFVTTAVVVACSDGRKNVFLSDMKN